MLRVDCSLRAATVRFDDNDKIASTAADTQRAINATARVVIGARLADRVPTSELMHKAKLTSYNRLAVRAIALEAWKALNSSDGPDGGRNPVGRLLSSSSFGAAGWARSSRSVSDGRVPPPLPVAAPTLVHHAYRLWNSHRAIRDATSLSAAKAASAKIASGAPL